MADRAVRGQQTFELVLPGRGFRHDPDQEFFVLGCEQPVFEKGLDQACRRRRRTTVQVLVLDPVVHRFFRGGNERVFDAEAAHVFFDGFGASGIFEQDVASVVVAVRYAVSQQFRYRNRKVPAGVSFSQRAVCVRVHVRSFYADDAVQRGAVLVHAVEYGQGGVEFEYAHQREQDAVVHSNDFVPVGQYGHPDGCSIPGQHGVDLPDERSALRFCRSA